MDGECGILAIGRLGDVNLQHNRCEKKISDSLTEYRKLGERAGEGSDDLSQAIAHLCMDASDQEARHQHTCG